jgi:hypothetical protein
MNKLEITNECAENTNYKCDKCYEPYCDIREISCQHKNIRYDKYIVGGKIIYSKSVCLNCGKCWKGDIQNNGY